MLIIEKDELCSMVKISSGKKVLFEGNEWDLPRTATDLAEFLNKLDIKNKVIDYKFGG